MRFFCCFGFPKKQELLEDRLCLFSFKFSKHMIIIYINGFLRIREIVSESVNIDSLKPAYLYIL